MGVTATGGRFAAAAAELGHRLCRDALWAHDRCIWLGDSLEALDGEWTVVHGTCGPDLYNGTSGIALFLAELARHTDEPLHRVTAEAAMRHALAHAHDVPPTARLGLYSGWPGIALAARVVADALGRADLEAAGRGLLTTLARSADGETRPHDILSGRAGAIPVLLAAHARAPADELIALAIRCADELVDAADRSDRGWSWAAPDAAPGDPNLTGLSHGAAGIGWALLELAHVTGEDRFRVAATQAFRYEQSWFDATSGNWADLRGVTAQGGEQGRGSMIAWCHGAPGIGLTRLRAAALTGDPARRAEAEIARGTTSAALHRVLAGGLGDLSLCHGAAGNAELLLQHPDDDVSRMLTEGVADEAVQRFGDCSQPWPCGVPGGGETPGLMLGIAGIGHFFLRMHDPDIRSVLLPV